VAAVAERAPALRHRQLALLAVVAAGLALPGSSVATTAASDARTATAAKLVVGATGQLGAAARRAGAKSSGTRPGAPAGAKSRKQVPPPVPLSGWLANGIAFPHRAVVLGAPSGRPLTLGALQVSENGAPVLGATLTPTAQAGKGDFGVMLAVDQSTSMSGGPIRAAMSAVRSFAAQRSGQQELGLITFDGTPNLILHPTSDATSIRTVLAGSPWTGPGANVPAATRLALSSLSEAKVALGAVVVVSDGVGRLVSSQGPTPAFVGSQAAAARVPVFTVGLQDAHSTPAALAALKAASPGQFVPATAAQLPSVLQQIYSTLTRAYVLRYRSAQPAGHPVSLTVAAAGVPGSVQVSYRTPPAAKPQVRATPRSTPAAKKQAGPDFSHTTLLSPQPAFAPQAVVPPQPTSTSFWQSSGSVPAIAGIVGVLLALALTLVLHRPSKRAVRLRVGSFIPSAGDGEGDAAVLTTTPKQERRRLFKRARWWGPFVQDVEISRSSHSPTDLVKRGAAGGVVLALLVFLISGSPVIAFLPLLLWPLPLRWFVKRAARKQRELFIDSLPGYLQDLASAMRVGRSFASALGIVASSADEPTRSELERAVRDETLGRPLDESLEAVALRMRATDMDQVALIASLGRRSGSNVAEALDRVADGARDRSDLRREIKGLTAQAKMSSLVLTSLPPLLLVAISVISPQYAHPLLHTTIGIILLVVAALMVFAGWKVMKKITTMKA
jgi:tight adherence protein B